MKLFRWLRNIFKRNRPETRKYTRQESEDIWYDSHLAEIIFIDPELISRIHSNNRRYTQLGA